MAQKIDINKVIDVGQTVFETLQKEATKSSNNMTQTDVNKVAPQVEAKIKEDLKKEVQPILDNLTNNEANWYQKRSFWSAIVSLGAVVITPIAANYGLDGYLDEKTLDMIVEGLTRVGGIVAAYLAYRAGTALKPLGS